jgi:hypothetical protein
MPFAADTRYPNRTWELTTFSPSRAIEIHDSILERISVSRGQAQLPFSCIYIHQSAGEPGRAAASVTPLRESFHASASPRVGLPG